jgi:hypothetical protein
MAHTELHTLINYSCAADVPRLSHKSITAVLVIVTQKVLIYKIRVAAGFTSAVHRREASPRPTRVKMVTFWDSLSPSAASHREVGALGRMPTTEILYL